MEISGEAMGEGIKMVVGSLFVGGLIGLLGYSLYLGINDQTKTNENVAIIKYELEQKGRKTELNNGIKLSELSDMVSKYYAQEFTGIDSVYGNGTTLRFNVKGKDGRTHEVLIPSEFVKEYVHKQLQENKK